MKIHLKYSENLPVVPDDEGGNWKRKKTKKIDQEKLLRYYTIYIYQWPLIAQNLESGISME